MNYSSKSIQISEPGNINRDIIVYLDHSLYLEILLDILVFVLKLFRIVKNSPNTKAMMIPKVMFNNYSSKHVNITLDLSVAIYTR